MSIANISTCEMHTCGEPLRIIEDGFPQVSGRTILEKIEYIKGNLDHIRKFLMFEPRGHYDMYGTLRVEADDKDADVAFIFMHNAGYSTMCGHAVLALGRYVVDQGWVEPEEPETMVKIQCPCGLVPTYVSVISGVTGNVRFQSVPSFVFTKNYEVEVIGHGTMSVDVSYGGAFYAFVTIKALGLPMKKGNIRNIVSMAEVILKSAKKTLKIHHPVDDRLAFLYGVIVTDLSKLKSENVIRQMTIFADAELDRSPCGSGTSAHVALLHERGQISIGKEVIFESAVNETRFKAKAIGRVDYSEFKAVITEVSGKGHYTGKCTFTAERDDPLQMGFLVT